MNLRCTGVIAVALAIGLVRNAGAEPVSGQAMQSSRGIELGFLMHSGDSEFASTTTGLQPDAQGLLIRDRNGVTARMVIGLVIAIGSALAQSGPKSQQSTSYRSGDYIVTETTTTYYSEAEKAQMAAATSDTIDSLFSAKYSDFELDLYAKDRFSRGNASGYKLNMYVGSGDKVAFETGLGFGHVSSLVDNAGMPTTVDWKYLGMPFRVSTVVSKARVSLSYEWNWVKYGMSPSEQQLHMDGNGGAIVRTVSHPWHLDISTMVLGRITLGAGVTAQQIQRTKYGYFATAGLFF